MKKIIIQLYTNSEGFGFINRISDAHPIFQNPQKSKSGVTQYQTHNGRFTVTMFSQDNDVAPTSITQKRFLKK